MQGDQRRGFLAKVLTLPAVVIDSHQALIYFTFSFYKEEESAKSVFATGNDKRQRFCEHCA